MGTGGIAFLEGSNPATLGGLSVEDRILPAFFHSASARTAGFNTMDLHALHDETLYLLMLLMVIGGSPGSTAGGIKTTTWGIVCVFLWSVLRWREDVTIFYRRLPTEIVHRALALVLLAFGAVTGCTLVLSWIESQSFLPLMFEVSSALGTVGLSVGDGGTRSLSAIFTPLGKGVIILCMICGRFGPLMLGLIAVRSMSHLPYRYPAAKVAIG